MKNLLAVVMCGGESRRMGRDKGLIQKEQIPWAKIVSNIFEKLHLPCVVSVNEAQVERYSELFPRELLVIDKDISVKGPLTGLLSVHQQYPDKNLLLIACDMVDMKPETVSELLVAYRAESGCDFYGFKTAQFFEPFCSIYSGSFLKQIVNKATHGELRQFSMQNIINSGKQMAINPPEKESFNNYNTPEENLR